MATLDLSTAEDRVRLNIGDTSDIAFLTTAEITYSLSVNNNNENAATKQCAQFILARVAYSGHERLDKLEFYGDTVFNQYMRFLKEVVNNPTYNATAGIYVGGQDLLDVQANLQDSTLVQKRIINYPKDSYRDDDKSLYNVPDIEEDGYNYFSNY